MVCPKKTDDEKDESGGASGSGRTGTGSKVGVRIATMAGDSRDEPSTPAERRRFAAAHELTQAERVRRARERKKELKAAREKGPVSLNQRQAYTGGGGGGPEKSPHASHPLLSKAAQFSGMEESPIPSDNRQKDANEEDREKLVDRPENKLQNRLTLKQAPKYSPPKPRPY